MTRSELEKKYDNFFKTFNNKSLDYDGYYGGQCFDLIQAWNIDWLGCPNWITGDYAYQIYGQLPQYYDSIANTPDAIPQKGDIIVWAKAYNGFAGHTGVANGVGDTNTFECFEQNDPTGTVCHVKKYTYNNVTGWLRWKTKENASGGTVEIDSTTFTNLVRKSTIADKVREKLNVADNETVILAEIEKLITFEDAVRQKDKQLDTANEEIARLQDEVKKLKADHDLLSAQNQELIVKTDEQQSKMEKLAQEALQRQDTIDDQGDIINQFQSQLDALKQTSQAPVFTGIKKIIYKLLLSL